jgi:dethiobiotin synthetase
VTAYFVTGTDTGVGKTIVAAGLLAHARARGLRTAALKPAETGCVHGVPTDGLLLRAAAGADHLPIDAIVPHRYATPVAPAVAARLEGRPFSLARTRTAFAALAGADLLLVEGAGGLLSPYADYLLAADLAAALALPLLIVARAGLGTINHTLLTVAEARRRGLTVAGVILSRVSAAPDPSEATNRAEIGRRIPVPVLGTLEHVAENERLDPAALGSAVARAGLSVP